MSHAKRRRTRPASIAVLAALALAAFFAAARTAAPPPPQPAPDASLAAAFGAARRNIEPDGAALAAHNPEHDLRVRFDADGALRIAAGEHAAAFRLTALGRGDESTEIGAGRWTASGQRAENRRAGVTEYVENRADGIEQGFIIDSKPSGDAPLSLILESSGGLIAAASPDGQRVVLKNASGAEVLAYEKLRVWDANGTEIKARMKTSARAIELEVDDAEAVYPLTIDPTFVQTQKVVSSATNVGFFGSTVAVSGNTVVVGARDENIGANPIQGAAYVFVKNGSVWQQQAKLIAPDGEAIDGFGWSVAISGDTIIVGAPGDEPNGVSAEGSAYIFVRTGNVWQIQSKIFPTGAGTNANFGSNVSISGDTAAIGVPLAAINGNSQQGAVYVFVRGGGTWTMQTRLTLSAGSAGDQFGCDVALSGSSLLVGASGEDVLLSQNQGAAYFFTRSGTSWSSPSKLSANDATANDNFGASVDFTNTFSGPVAVVGAPGDTPVGVLQAGSAYVLERSQIGTWSQTQKFFDPNGKPLDLFGGDVAIDPLGNAIAIGTRQNDGEVGGYVYRRTGNVWALGQRVYGSNHSASDKYGYSVALTGSTLVVGAPWADAEPGDGRGATYIYELGQRPFDFDGDARTDFSIYRPNGNQWWLNRSGDSVTNVVTLGATGDVVLPGDFTGDGKTDAAVWRPSNSFWYVIRSQDGSFYSFPFGANGDIPAPADYDGDGITDPAVFRPSGAVWYILRSSDGATAITTFGAPGDKPVPADYDGDNKADIAIFRPSGVNGAEWWLIRSASGTSTAIQFGISSDKAVPGDYTGDGKADIAFYRSSNRYWFVLRSEDSSYFSFPFGALGDVPAPGDYDGDGRFDAAVFRQSTSTWYAQTATANTLIAQFGGVGDQPLPNSYVR